MPLIHSQNIQNEHTRYINSLEKIISKKLKNVRGGKKTFSFDIYKISYSAFVLTTELAKKSRQNRTSSYLQELRSEIVSTVALTTIGFDSSLHLRRCIELALKHIFYADHPIEYTISMESRKSKEDLTVKELFDYAKKNPLL
ncbi:MAG: hypothetical protein L6408_00340, partial [Nanoarchaeota archaeon]|nr:hypothetical protein [Nanoarchaeota archaeon]